MVAWFDAILAIWRSLANEQKLAVVMFLFSIPLGVLSLMVGIYHGDMTLAAAGVVNLCFALWLTITLGWLLFKLLKELIKLVLRLPQILWRWLKRFRRSAESPELPVAERRIVIEAAELDQTVRQLKMLAIFGLWALLQVYHVRRLSVLLGG